MRVARGAGHGGPGDSGSLPGGQGASLRPQPPEKQGSPVRLAWVPPSRAVVPLGLSCTEALCSQGLAGQPGPSTEDNITQPCKPRPRKTPSRWEAFRLVLSGESGQDCRNPLPEGLAEAQGSGRAHPAKARAGPGSGRGGQGQQGRVCFIIRSVRWEGPPLAHRGLPTAALAGHPHLSPAAFAPPPDPRGPQTLPAP